MYNHICLTLSEDGKPDRQGCLVFQNDRLTSDVGDTLLTPWSAGGSAVMDVAMDVVMDVVMGVVALS
jgi:hypothetical protein